MIVCGGRGYRRYDLVFAWLDANRPDVLIHGDAPGSDTGADVWAVVNGYTPNRNLFRVPAKWRENGVYNPKAGPERNQYMLDNYKPTCVVAFPGGRGTADMVERANAAGIEVIEPTKAKAPVCSDAPEALDSKHQKGGSL